MLVNRPLMHSIRAPTCCCYIIKRGLSNPECKGLVISIINYVKHSFIMIKLILHSHLCIETYYSTGVSKNFSRLRHV